MPVLYKYGLAFGGGTEVQKDEMPTATAQQLGQVYQYVGPTDINYTHGYYYECKFNGVDYYWDQTDVQPSSDVDPLTPEQINNLISQL